jgi:hypothetical protein
MLRLPEGISTKKYTPKKYPKKMVDIILYPQEISLENGCFKGLKKWWIRHSKGLGGAPQNSPWWPIINGHATGTD